MEVHARPYKTISCGYIPLHKTDIFRPCNVGKNNHKPSPSHHHFYVVCLPFPVMAGKHGIVLPTFMVINSDS